MYLRDILGNLLRRWPILVGGALATVALCVALVTVVPATFIARTSMVLLPPAAIVGDDGNPFLYLGGLDQALDVLTRRLNAEELSNDVEDDFPDASYSVYADTTTSGPIVVVEVEATSAADTEAVMERIVGEAAPSLRSLQVDLDVPTDSLITITVLAVDQEPEADYKTRIQLVGGAGAVGLVGTILLAGYLESRASARRQRQEESSAVKSSAAPSPKADAADEPERSTSSGAESKLFAPRPSARGPRPRIARRGETAKLRNPADPDRGTESAH